MEYKPPFSITDHMIQMVSEISEFIGHINTTSHLSSDSKLRRDNRIRTIQASLAIENNSLSLEQVTAILNGKRILGAPQEIQEVKNAYEAYEILLAMNPYSMESLLNAHKILMLDLVKEAGRFRSGEVGIFTGERVAHVAPPADRVPEFMRNLIAWYQVSPVHPLIKSCVFHYEFEFIHPFSDGNGRMGRMWHTLLLSQWKEVFAWVPVETLVKERQSEYDQALGKADHAADSTVFIAFMMKIMRDALAEIISGAVTEK